MSGAEISPINSRSLPGQQVLYLLGDVALHHAAVRLKELQDMGGTYPR
jgi:hypothetical protein